MEMESGTMEHEVSGKTRRKKTYSDQRGDCTDTAIKRMKIDEYL